MKTKGSAIIRRILGIGVTAATMILTLGIPAFARPADPDPRTPVAPVAPLQNASGGRAWLIPLIIGGAIVLVAALIGAVRFQRSGQLAADA
jgi:hypothetical protein